MDDKDMCDMFKQNCFMSCEQEKSKKGSITHQQILISIK